MKFRNAFTMVELLVSMAIIGILIATAIWGIGLAQQNARNTQRMTVGTEVLAGLTDFYSRYGVLPKIVCSTADGSEIRISNVNACTDPNAKSIVIKTPGSSKSNQVNMGPLGGHGTLGTSALDTTYIIGVDPTTQTGIIKGYQICIYLEGGGVKNLSDPPSIICDGQ